MKLVSAYKQISQAERAVVDAIVQWYESESDRRSERLLETFKRPLPDDLVERSRDLVTRPLVSAATTERITLLAQERELSQERIIKELMAIAFTNPARITKTDEFGKTTLDLDAATEMEKAAVKSIDYEEAESGMTTKSRLKVQFHDKLTAIKMLCEITGLTSGENTHYHIARSDASEIIDAETTDEAAGDIYAALIEGD